MSIKQISITAASPDGNASHDQRIGTLGALDPKRGPSGSASGSNNTVLQLAAAPGSPAASGGDLVLAAGSVAAPVSLPPAMAPMAALAPAPGPGGSLTGFSPAAAPGGYTIGLAFELDSSQHEPSTPQQQACLYEISMYE